MYFYPYNDQIIYIFITAQYQIGTAEPTLMFYKSDSNSSVEYLGRGDEDSLIAFIDDQMGRSGPKYEARKHIY